MQIVHLHYIEELHMEDYFNLMPLNSANSKYILRDFGVILCGNLTCKNQIIECPVL